MNELAIKDVQFNGSTLRAAQDINKIIWVGVRWVCEGLGLTEGQMKNERKKIQTDEVLAQGTKFHPLGSGNSDSEVLCLNLEFLPIWLAKIHVTPKMKHDNPLLADKLIAYQLKAKDVLAEAFLGNNSLVPQENYAQQITELQNTVDAIRQENQKMYNDMKSLANVMLDLKEAIDKKNSTSPVVVELNNQSWKSSIYEKMDHICANTSDFEKRANIMRWIYRYINKNYGVVWDQEIREYKERNKTHMLPSTIDVVQDKPIIRSIFESVLSDLEYKYCRQKNGTESPVCWVDQVVAPLVKKYNDHSTSPMVTYRKIYRRMNENGKIAWKNMTTRYINEHGKKPSKKDLIETRPTLRKKFRQTVKELMEEKEGE